MAYSGAASASVPAEFYMQTARRQRFTRELLNAVSELSPVLAHRSSCEVAGVESDQDSGL